MIFHLDTWYKNQDGHGNSLSCLKLELKTASNETRDQVRIAIMKCLIPKESVEEKQPVLGFTMEPT